MTTTLIRRAAASAATAGVLLGAFAPSATAADGHTSVAPSVNSGWHCTTSFKSIDNPGYTGIWPDNVNFTARVCAQRLGRTVTTRTHLTWSTPYFSAGNVFNDAYGREYVKRSVRGPDPIVCARTTDRIQHVIGRPGSSGTLHSKGKRCNAQRWAVGDFALRLDWKYDGAGDLTYKFRASPRV